MKKDLKTLILIWVFWMIIITSFQAMVTNRLDLQRPDRVLSWTAVETEEHAHYDQPYLLDPLFNNQVAWDSEFYISISHKGYDDPQILSKDGTSLNYAFFPLYPFLMKILRIPFTIFLSPVGASTMAGILISALGTLGGMISLYFLADTKNRLSGAFYLLIFPSSFFLITLYTEGLFLGLTFGTLAFLKHKKLIPALLLASLAVWTKGVGILLIIPFVINAFKDRKDFKQVILKTAFSLIPLAAFLLWKIIFGKNFNFIENNFFHRKALSILSSYYQWKDSFLSIFFGDNTQASIYYLLESGAIALASFSCLFYIRKKPELALTGLGIVFISLTSNVPTGMIRYVLPVPTLYLFLSDMSRNKVFDRVFPLFSILLLGMEATLFAFNFWVA